MQTISFMFKMGTPAARLKEVVAEIAARPDMDRAGQLVPLAKETSVTLTMCYAVPQKGANINVIIEDILAYSEIESAEPSAERYLAQPEIKQDHGHDHGHGHGDDCGCGHKH